MANLHDAPLHIPSEAHRSIDGQHWTPSGQRPGQMGVGEGRVAVEGHSADHDGAPVGDVARGMQRGPWSI